MSKIILFSVSLSISAMRDIYWNGEIYCVEDVKVCVRGMVRYVGGS